MTPRFVVATRAGFTTWQFHSDRGLSGNIMLDLCFEAGAAGVNGRTLIDECRA